MKPEEIITDVEMDQVHANANFGSTPKRDVIAEALLKTVCGYSTGHTARCIIQEHGLVNRPRNPHAVPKVLKKGRQYLWAAFGGTSV
jgi:hypothetical protein